MRGDDRRWTCGVQKQSNNRKNAGHFIFTSIYSNHSLRERPFMGARPQQTNSRTTIESAIWYSSIHHFLLICRVVGLCVSVFYMQIFCIELLSIWAHSVHIVSQARLMSSSSMAAAAVFVAVSCSFLVKSHNFVRSILLLYVQEYAQFSNSTVCVYSLTLSITSKYCPTAVCWAHTCLLEPHIIDFNWFVFS